MILPLASEVRVGFRDFGPRQSDHFPRKRATTSAEANRSRTIHPWLLAVGVDARRWNEQARAGA